MQTNNRTNSVRKLWWVALSIGIIVCVFTVPAVWLSFSSNIFSNTYRLGMLAMGAASVLNPAGQLYHSYGRTRLAIVLTVLGGIASIAALILIGLSFSEIVR